MCKLYADIILKGIKYLEFWVWVWVFCKSLANIEKKNSKLKKKIIF